MLVTFLLGFSSGLPLLLTSSSLQTWMTEAGIQMTSIGLVAYLGLPYTLKFLWAPLFDSVVPPFLGRRRGWLLMLQLAIAALVYCMSFGNPATSALPLVLTALAVVIFSASQDIVVDAHRRDLLPEGELGVGTGFYINGYRLGMLLGGAGALWLADDPLIGWSGAYRYISLGMLVGVCGVLLLPEPDGEVQAGGFRDSVLLPLKEFFNRLPLKESITILLFVMLYKFGDAFAGTLTSPFYIKMGYTKTEIATAAKLFGLVATLIGGLAGGYLVQFIGIGRALWICGILQALSTLGFALLAQLTVSPVNLSAVVGFENLTGAMGTVAYASYMMSLCNRSFSATQYALLSSIMAVPRTLFGGSSGAVQLALGWEWFFIVSTAAAIPGLLLLMRVQPWGSAQSISEKGN
jgi:PAT family beta-lactamase induction signal transducer AmpG